MSQLAREIDLDPASVQREVGRLEAAGILASERVGTARLVFVDTTSPIHAELSGLVLKTLGPPVVLAEALADVPGVALAFIFGSWAGRITGEPGPAPVDIDLLVVGEPDRRALSQACSRAALRLGRDVSPTVVTSNEWNTPRTGFVKTLQLGSLVPVDLEHSNG